jgi:DEAD/DEAH box helicase domain-containing protein
VRRVDSDYFTNAIDYTQVRILDEFDSSQIADAKVLYGDVRVNRQIVGFKKVKFFTLENVGAGNLSMPEQEMHTTAFWIHFPEAFLNRFPELGPADRQSAIAGLANALRSVAALLLMCDPRDLGVAITEDISEGLKAYEPNLYLYDAYPGGIGQSAPLFKIAPRLLAHARELIAHCPCEAGCPSCVGPVGEVGERGKEAAGRFLAVLDPA